LSFLILLATSEIRVIYVEETIENLVGQPAGRHENDFASSINTFFTSVRTEADRIQRREHLTVPTI
jgi:hypothetical protein